MKIPEKQAYEICPMCNGSGSLTPESKGAAPIRCIVCKPLHVVPIGLTVEQIERMAKKQIQMEEDKLNSKTI